MCCVLKYLSKCQILVTTVIITCILRKIIFIWPTYTYGLRRLIVGQNQLIDMGGTSSLEDFIFLMMFNRNLRKALKANGPPD